MAYGKKGIELALNFLVIIILSIVIFSLSLVFLVNLFKSPEQALAQITANTESQIFATLFEGKKTQVYPSSLTIRTGKSETIGIGIQNIVGNDNKFFIQLTDGKTPSGQILKNQSYQYQEIVQVDTNNAKIVPVLIKIGKNQELNKQGERYILNAYIYQCNVLDCSNPLSNSVYGTHQIKITVE